MVSRKHPMDLTMGYDVVRECVYVCACARVCARAHACT